MRRQDMNIAQLPLPLQVRHLCSALTWIVAIVFSLKMLVFKKKIMSGSGQKVKRGGRMDFFFRDFTLASA